MNDVHRAHCTTSIVENPLLVEVQVLAGQFLVQLRDDVAHHGAGVVSMGGNGALGQVMQMRRLEDVEPLEVFVEIDEQGREERQDESEDGEG